MSSTIENVRVGYPFIVDNGEAGATAAACLERWAGDSRSIDIATGYFDVGALLRLDGSWQKLGKVRLLLGAPTNHRTRKALEANRRVIRRRP